MFIVFEGVDGSGKTTVARQVYDTLCKYLGDDKVIFTREPGGTPMAEKIRELILTTPESCEDMLPVTQALLFSAARHQHVENVIKPALEAGKVVICDRFVASTYAYQVGQGVSMRQADALSSVACNGIFPYLTLWMQVTKETALTRMSSRGNPDSMEQRSAKYEQMTNVYQIYMDRCTSLLSSNTEWCKIDSEQPLDRVVGDVIQAIFRSKHWTNFINRPIDVDVLSKES